jgi:hypothetical protein
MRPSPVEASHPEPDQSPSPESPESAQPQPPAQPSEPTAQEIQRENARIAYALRQEERRIAAEKAEIEAARKKLDEELNASKSAERDFLKLDPLSALERLSKERGIPFEVLMRDAIARMSNGGKPTPEQEMEDLKRRLQEQDERWEASKREREEREAREAQAAQEAQREQILANFRDEFASLIDENHHPYLSTLDTRDTVERAMREANEHARLYGEVPDFGEVLDELERQEKESFDARAMRRGYARQDSPPPQTHGNDPRVDEAMMQRDASGRFTPRVVSNATASARGSAPVDWKKLSDRERLERAGEEVFGPTRR